MKRNKEKMIRFILCVSVAALIAGVVVFLVISHQKGKASGKKNSFSIGSFLGTEETVQDETAEFSAAEETGESVTENDQEESQKMYIGMENLKNLLGEDRFAQFKIRFEEFLSEQQVGEFETVALALPDVLSDQEQISCYLELDDEVGSLYLFVYSYANDSYNFQQIEKLPEKLTSNEEEKQTNGNEERTDFNTGNPSNKSGKNQNSSWNNDESSSEKNQDASGKNSENKTASEKKNGGKNQNVTKKKGSKTGSEKSQESDRKPVKKKSSSAGEKSKTEADQMTESKKESSANPGSSSKQETDTTKAAEPTQRSGSSGTTTTVSDYYIVNGVKFANVKIYDGLSEKAVDLFTRSVKRYWSSIGESRRMIRTTKPKHKGSKMIFTCIYVEGGDSFTVTLDLNKETFSFS